MPKGETAWEALRVDWVGVEFVLGFEPADRDIGALGPEFRVQMMASHQWL